MTEDLKEFIKEQNEETRRHFDVVAEDLKSEIQTVAEQVGVNTEKLTEHDGRFESIETKLTEHDGRFKSIETKLTEHDGRFESIETKLTGHDGRFEHIETTLEVMKQDINVIKHDLKQKVDRDEFAALERRVGSLEVKLRPA